MGAISGLQGGYFRPVAGNKAGAVAAAHGCRAGHCTIASSYFNDQVAKGLESLVFNGRGEPARGSGDFYRGWWPKVHPDEPQYTQPKLSTGNCTILPTAQASISV